MMHTSDAAGTYRGPPLACLQPLMPILCTYTTQEHIGETRKCNQLCRARLSRMGVRYYVTQRSSDTRIGIPSRVDSP